jgi:hypothetical protein
MTILCEPRIKGPGVIVVEFAMTFTTITPSTGKVRRDVIGGKRGQGKVWGRRVRRADPSKIAMAGTREKLTGNAGLVRFGCFMRELGVPNELRRLFFHLKSGRLVVYPMEAQVQLLIDAHVAGESRVFGVEALAADPLFVRLAGGTVPSVDTIYRDLGRFDDEGIASLEELLASHGLDRDGLRRHREHHLDIDTSVLSLNGEHEGAAIGYNPRNHSRPSMHPIVARSAELDTCVGAILRPGDTGFGTDDAPSVARIVRRMKKALTPKQSLYVRIDAAADCTAILSAITAERAMFVVKARLTRDLRDAVAATARWRTVDRDAMDRPIAQAADIDFAREEWRKVGLAVRVVAVRTKEPGAGKQVFLWPDEEYTVKVYLTNATQPAEDVAKRYEGRAGVEPLIAEWKNGWGIGEMPCWDFKANHAAMLIKLLAHNLMRRFVRAVAPRLARARWRIEWLRRALINVAGKLVRTGRRWILNVPQRSELLACQRE